MVQCSWKSEFGVDCLTCGVQRSFHLLTKGELVESVKMFPALIPFLIVIALVVIHLSFKLKKGPELIVSFFILTAILIIVNYSLKMELPPI